ncbi:hypothetical protein D3C78_1614680 [compost metagenome]
MREEHVVVVKEGRIAAANSLEPIIEHLGAQIEVIWSGAVSMEDRLASLVPRQTLQFVLQPLDRFVVQVLQVQADLHPAVTLRQQRKNGIVKQLALALAMETDDCGNPFGWL